MRFAVLIYDDVEPIDLGATFGVLSMARRMAPDIETVALARSLEPVICANGLKVMPDEDYKSFSGADVLIVTGGPGWMRVAKDPDTLEFLKNVSGDVKLAAICTGAMILAAAGLLDGCEATTKVEIAGAEIPPLAILEKDYATITARQAVAVSSNGCLTSGGVSLGIDGVFYLLAQTHGGQVAKDVARIMEYSRALKANAASAPPIGFTKDVLEIAQ